MTTRCILSVDRTTHPFTVYLINSNIIGYIAHHKSQQRAVSTDSKDSHVRDNVDDNAVPPVNVPHVIHINDNQQICEIKMDLKQKEQEHLHTYRPWEKSIKKTVGDVSQCEIKKDLEQKEQEHHHIYRPWEKSIEKTVDEHKYRPWELSSKNTVDEQCYPKRCLTLLSRRRSLPMTTPYRFQKSYARLSKSRQKFRERLQWIKDASEEAG